MFMGYLNNQAKGFPSPLRFLPPKHTQQKGPPLAALFVRIFPFYCLRPVFQPDRRNFTGSENIFCKTAKEGVK
jgi:hypothetical protein